MGYCRDDDKNVTIMAKEHKKLNSHVKKFLEETQTRYEKHANKFKREI
jgi:hypothetical protein